MRGSANSNADAANCSTITNATSADSDTITDALAADCNGIAYPETGNHDAIGSFIADRFGCVK